METYDRWEPVSGVDMPAAEIVLHVDPAVSLRLRFSFLTDAPPRDLVLAFRGHVVACMSFEEFAHPWQVYDSTGPVPRLEGPWASYAFPLLRVRDSIWLASFADSQVLEEDRRLLTHYRFVSLDNTVDVLASGDVLAEWSSVEL